MRQHRPTPFAKNRLTWPLWDGFVWRRDSGIKLVRGWWLDGVWTEGRMDGRFDRGRERWMDRWLDSWLDGWLREWMNGWVDCGAREGWMEDWIEGGIDEWLDGYVDWMVGCINGWLREWMNGWDGWMIAIDERIDGRCDRDSWISRCHGSTDDWIEWVAGLMDGGNEWMDDWIDDGMRGIGWTCEWLVGCIDDWVDGLRMKGWFGGMDGLVG